MPQSAESELSSGPKLWNESDEEEVIEGSIAPTEASSAICTARVFTLFILLWQSMFRIGNVAVSVLLCFLSLFFHYLSVMTQVDSIESISKLLPNTLNKAHKIVMFNRNDFHQYVCCPKCFRFTLLMIAWSV